MAQLPLCTASRQVGQEEEQFVYWQEFLEGGCLTCVSSNTSFSCVCVWMVGGSVLTVGLVKGLSVVVLVA